uniref:YciI family protein n=1 Tax=Fulvivirga sp. TaxID=1931237 RepID=UPI00404AE318
MTNENELSGEERDLFEKLKGIKPPIEMEEETISKLKAEGLIQSQNKMIWVYRVAAAIAFFILGYSVFPYLNSNESPAYNYMLVLYEDANFKPGPPEEMFDEYSHWMQGIYQNGMAIDGQEMKPASLLLDGADIRNNATKTVGGYFVLSASSQEEAVKIAQSSPHLKYGGTIEVKEFMIR